MTYRGIRRSFKQEANIASVAHHVTSQKAANAEQLDAATLPVS